MHQYQVNAEGGEQIEVVREIEEATIGHEIAAKSDNENLAAKSVDIRRDRLKPVDETVLTGQTLPAHRLQRVARTFSSRFLVFPI